MDKKNLIVVIVAAVFNIAAVVLNACGLSEVKEVLYEIMPYVDTLVLGLLTLFGVQAVRAGRRSSGGKRPARRDSEQQPQS
jgi:uncharacterized membrane protein